MTTYIIYDDVNLGKPKNISLLVKKTYTLQIRIRVKLDFSQFANLIQVEEKLKKSAKHI